MSTYRARAAAAALKSSFIAGIICTAALTPAGAQGVRPDFDAPQIIAGPYNRITNILDLDGDTWTDAVGIWWGINAGEIVITGWTNDQTGRLVKAWDVPMNVGSQYVQQTYAPATGDFDADGDEDFIFIVGDDVLVFLSNGAQPPTLFQSWTISAFATYGTYIAVADFNGDGRLDFAVNDSGTLRLYRNTGTLHGPLFVEHSTKTMSPLAKELVAVECTGDTTPDLVATLGVNSWIFPVIDGVIQDALPVVTHGISGETKTVAGDMDNDGDPDIAVFDMITQYAMERRTGPSTFAPEPLVLGGPVVKLTDLDNDGDLDGICCGGGGPPSAPYNNGPSIFRITYNVGGGSFLPAIEFPGLGSIYIAGAADLDKDGDKDLVAGRCIYYAQKPWGVNSFSAAPFTSVPATGLQPSDPCDIDMDGDPDLKLGLTGPLANAGNAVLTPTVLTMPAPPDGTSYWGPGIRGDFDGDGDPDLIVSLRQGTTGYNFISMRFLENMGGGGFIDAAPATAPGVVFNQSNGIDDPRYYLVTDVDDDGDLDVCFKFIMPFLGGSWLASGSIWVNDGTPFFTSGATFSAAPLAAADFDGDGVKDILAAAGGNAKMDIYFGLGGGLYGPPVNLAANGGYYLLPNPQTDRMAVEDLDKDGDVDVAFIHSGYNSNVLVAFRNNGDGTFLTTAPSGGNDIPKSYSGGFHVFAVDLDANGVKELVVSPYGASLNAMGVARLVDAQAFTWSLTEGYVARVNTIDDFDGDGDPDAIADSTVPNTTRVVYGSRVGTTGSNPRRQYGQGTAGTLGMVPTIGAKGPFTLGSLVDYRVNGGYGGSLALVVLGSAESNLANSPLPGLTSYCDPWWGYESIQLGGAAGTPGGGNFSAFVPVSPGLVGMTVYHQGFIYDPAAPYLITATNGLELRFGM
jgi:hypothetical protein